MTMLRVLLFSGLVLHKLIWEIWKRKTPLSEVTLAPQISPMKKIVKLGKIAVLIFLLVQTLFLNVFPMSNPHSSVLLIGLFLYVSGLALAITGRVTLGPNWRDLEDRQVMTDQSLTTKGIYAFIRHPIYAGDMMLIVGLQLALQSWVVIFALLLVAVVVRQTLAEEKLLSNSFPAYREYCARTKRFVPFLI